MSSEPEQKPADQSAVSAETNSNPAETPASSAPEYAPGSVEARLLALDGPASKKALHDSRTLKHLGILYYVLAGLFVFFELGMFAMPHLPGFPPTMKTAIVILTWLLLPLVVILPAFGVALRTQRSTAAQWLFRIVAILGIVSGVLEMIEMVRQANIGGFIGELVSVLICIRLCVITYNGILFGKDAPSHNQLGYVRSKWKAGEKPDHIPEQKHKQPGYAKPCLYLAFLILPYSLWHFALGISEQIEYSNAQDYYEAGQTLFAEAGQATDPQVAIAKYAEAYFNFRRAASDPKNADVHVYLGLCAARGLGCAKDSGEAFRQLTLHPSATNFFPDAEYELGLLYLYGCGTTQDIKQAAVLLKDAAAKGQRDAKAILGYDMSDLDENGNEVEGAETSYTEPDYGGLTVEQYLEKKIHEEAVRNAGKDASDAVEAAAGN
jgi:hypothetical protein